MQTAQIDDRHRRAAELRAEGHTQLEAADAVGVSARTIRAWEKDGKLAFALADSGARPDGPEAGAEAKGSSANGGPPSLSKARARKEAALAEKHELEVQRIRGELVPVEHVEAMVRDAVEPIDRALRTAHARMDVSAIAGEHNVSEGAVVHLLRELADGIRADLLAHLEERFGDG